MDERQLLRSLPKVDELLAREDIAALLDIHPRALVLDALRGAIEGVRARVLGGEPVTFDGDSIVGDALAALEAAAKRSLRRVVNATGIVIHTNLGRSPISAEAVEAVAEVAAGYSTLEYDVAEGERGSRHVHVEELLCRLTGAEAAMAVNNNASAVLLGIAGLARGKEAIVSRGQLVEIGGSFRIPDIMRESGATMVEVGTTNKTHLRDYESAITPATGLLLKVHSSNFRVVGFTTEVTLAELVELGGRHGIPVFEDQGSGVLIDLAPYGLPGEPTIGQSVAAGADIVSASGDKLLGGPQAGILVGKWHVIEKLKKHPLARAVRLDKMTLAALEVTLRAYLDPEKALRTVPVLRMLTVTHEELDARATALAAAISAACGKGCKVDVRDDVSRAGGGALPMADIPTRVVAVSPKGTHVNDVESRLRLGEPCVVARIKEDHLLFDPRTLLDGEDAIVADALARALSPAAGA